MNILQITTQAPGARSGGEMGIRQSLLSLIANGYSVDYVGPHIDDDCRGLYRRLYELEPSDNTLLRIWDTLHGRTNRRYRSWKALAGTLDMAGYDAVLLEFAKLDYVLDHIPHNRLMVRAHNVEADYSERNYRFHKSPAHLIEKMLAPKRERAVLGAAKEIAALTEEDGARLVKLYRLPEKKITVIPVCLSANENKTPEKEADAADISSDGVCAESRFGEKRDGVFTILLTGSLWFGPNYEGVNWFLQKVYPGLDFKKHIVIAGARPNDRLLETVSGLSDCEIVDSPASMDPYFKAADFYVAPVFDGAGMKVKVAEAMSYGLPVAGTGHAFIGYDIKGTRGLFASDDAGGLADMINEYQALDCAEKLRVRDGIRELFESRYSMNVSASLFKAMAERTAV